MAQAKKMFPIGTLVELTQPPFCSWNPWKKHDLGVVTGHNCGTDVVLEGDTLNSVDAERVRRVDYTDVYRMTNMRDEKVAGCLLENLPGERIVFIHDGHGSSDYRIAYLDRPMRRVPHYCHAGWLTELLAAGVIELVADEEPQVFNSVLEAPRGMVLYYNIKFASAQKGIVYPYIVRTVHSVWLYDKARGRWVNKPWDSIPTECPWVLDVQRVWSKVEAEMVEAFEYPRLPAVVEQFQQEILHNA